MKAEQFLTDLETATRHALESNDWTAWKAVQDLHFTYALKVSMTRAQRLRLHHMVHGFTVLADPDGTWSDQLSDRLEREYRESLVRAG